MLSATPLMYPQQIEAIPQQWADSLIPTPEHSWLPTLRLSNPMSLSLSLPLSSSPSHFFLSFSPSCLCLVHSSDYIIQERMSRLKMKRDQQRTSKQEAGNKITLLPLSPCAQLIMSTIQSPQQSCSLSRSLFLTLSICNIPHTSPRISFQHHRQQ